MLALDSSALIKRYQREEHSEWVRGQMSEDEAWCGSTLLAAETAIAVARAIRAADDLAKYDARISRDLEFFDMWPVDSECLTGAIELGRAYGLRALDAIHLSAFRLMPVDCRVITFDARMASAAREVGLDLLTPPGQ